MCSLISTLLIFLFSGLYFARCQMPFPGTCPEVKVVETFDLDKYMGTWYEYSKYPFVFEMGQKCQQAVYANLGNDLVSVVNKGVYIIFDTPSSISGTAKVLAPGQLAVQFKNQNVDTPNYLVLGTDYDNWVVVHSCKNVSAYGHVELLWILTRQRLPSDESIQAAEKIIKDNNLSEAFLMKSIQTGCPDDSPPTEDTTTISTTTTEISTTTVWESA